MERLPREAMGCGDYDDRVAAEQGGATPVPLGSEGGRNQLLASIILQKLAVTITSSLGGRKPTSFLHNHLVTHRVVSEEHRAHPWKLVFPDWVTVNNSSICSTAVCGVV